MPEERERVGGIFVDLGVDETNVNAALDRLEQRLRGETEKQHIIQVRVADQATPGSRAPKKQPANLAVEQKAAEQALKKIKPIAIPVTLSLAVAEINRLKQQITEAFANFSVSIKVAYESDGQSLIGGDEEPVPGTHGTVTRSRSGAGPIRKRIAAKAANPNISKPIIDRLAEGEKKINELQTLLAQSEPGGPAEAKVRSLMRDLTINSNKLRAYQSAGYEYEPLHELGGPRGAPQAGDIGKRRAKAARLTRRRPIAPTVAPAQAAAERETVEREAVEPLSRATRGVLGPDDFSHGETLEGAAAEAAEQEDRKRQAYARMEADIAGNARPTGTSRRGGLGPRVGPERRFRRREPAISQRRRSGPTVAFPRGSNPVIREGDIRGPNPVTTPDLFKIIEQYRRGEFGTTDEPKIAPVNQAGEYGEARAPSAEEAAFISNFGIKRGKTFNTSKGRFEVLDPRRQANRAATTYLNTLGEAERKARESDIRKFGEQLRNIKPGQGIFEQPGGGYQGVSRGPGPAARSSRDTPAGNLLSQQMLDEQAGRQSTIVRDPTLSLLTGSAAPYPGAPRPLKGRARIKLSDEEVADIAAQKAAMRDLPAARGFGKFGDIYEKFRAGDVDVSGEAPVTRGGKAIPFAEAFLKDREITPTTVARARIRATAERYKQEQRLGPRAPLPPEMAAEQRAIRSQINLDLKERADRATRISATERINKGRPGNRSFGPAESEEAELKEKLRRQLGDLSPAVRGSRSPVNTAPYSDATGIAGGTQAYKPAFIERIDERKDPRGARGGRAFRVTQPTPGLAPEPGAGITANLRFLDTTSSLLKQLHGPGGAAERAEAERQALVARGVNLHPVVNAAHKVLTGDEFTAKVMGTEAPKPRMPETVALGQAEAEASLLQAAATRAPGPHASGEAGGPVPPNNEQKLTAGGGGAPVPVWVKNFSELKGGISSRNAPIKVSEAKAPGTGIKSLAEEESTIKEAQVRRVRKQTLNQSMAEEGIDTGAREGLDPETKRRIQEIRLNAAQQLSVAQAANPARAFQSAVGSLFQRTLGGGAAFQGRLLEYRQAIGRNQAAQEQQVLAQQEEARANRTLDQATTKLTPRLEKIVGEFRAGGASEEEARTKALSTPEGGAIAKKLDLAAENARDATALRQRADERARVAAGEQEQQRRGLISPGQVVRGFAALGVGAIGGGLLYGAVSSLVSEAASTLIEKGIAPATDALTGFAATANKVSQELSTAADSIRTVNAGQLAVVGAAQAAGLGSAAGFGNLSARAEAQAAAQNQVQASDLFRASNNLGNNQFDQALFGGTGGVLGSAFLAPQPGLLERVVSDLTPAAGPTPSRSAQFGPRTPAQETAYATKAADLQQKKVDELNSTLGKVNSQFKFLTSATQAQKDAMIASGIAIGHEAEARQLAATGVAITNANGQALQGNQFGVALQQLAQGQVAVSPQLQFEADKAGLQAQVREFQRQRERELSFEQPSQFALQELTTPPLPVGTGLGASPSELKGLTAGLSEAQKLQDGLNAEFQSGLDILKQYVPQGLLDSITQVSTKIAQVQTGISNEQATYALHQYNNELRITERSYVDAAQLAGKLGSTNGDNLGLIERQNVGLQKQLTLLQQELQQRQINFQLAIAGFQTPGVTPEERQARVKEAEIEAKFAQKQLDIQKQLTKNQFVTIQIQASRGLTDAVHQLGLLREGRQVTLDTKVAEEQLSRLNKLQAVLVKQAGSYLSAVDKELALASTEIQKLETAYGAALDDITTRTVNGFISSIDAIYTALEHQYGGPNAAPYPGATDTMGGRSSGQHASGALFNTSGTTSMIVGEAGTETVAVLKNPRTVTASGGGGDIYINYGGVTVRSEADINDLVRKTVSAIGRHMSGIGLRPLG